MADVNELDCTFFVEADQSPDELAIMLADALSGTITPGHSAPTVHTPCGDIDVRRNPEFNGDRARQFPDGFLYFRYVLEFYPFPATRQEDREGLTANILNLLWLRGLAAVAACVYEAKLPQNGGYNRQSVPWPSRAAETTEALSNGEDSKALPPVLKKP